VWCHNPETQNYDKELLFDLEKCVGCGACAQVCPFGAVSLERQKARINRNACMACGRCTEYCTLNLRELAGKKYAVDELVKELEKDEMFYEESGGGVTLSGGEVMTADMDFVEELVRKLYQRGISVVIDTCGQAPYENFERILPFIDTFLYDIKVLDLEVHKKYMGAGNELILSNLEKLSSTGARIHIRIPTIREINGNKICMEKISKYLQEKRINPVQITLLPYHNTGASKYVRVGMDYQGVHLHAPTAEELKQFVEIFQKAGFQNTKY
jgi:pyruvate formate lyase activating enzyme